MFSQGVRELTARHGMRRPGVAPSVPGKTVATPFSVMHHLLLFFLLLLPCLAHGGKQWQLENYELCRHEILSGIPAEASGVTYSQVTNSLWVITRRPPAVFEYDLRGRKLREVSHRGLRDPEGAPRFVQAQSKAHGRVRFVFIGETKKCTRLSDY